MAYPCFNTSYTCTQMPPALNASYLTGLPPLPQGVACLNNPIIEFQANLSDASNYFTILERFKDQTSGKAAAVSLFDTFMPGSACDATYWMDATNCGGSNAFFEWDKTKLPEGTLCPAPK